MRYLLMCIFICSIYSLKACFCDTPTVESANFNHYETIFLGKVVKIERLEASVDHKDDIYTYVGTVTTFEILNNWKGEQRKFITIYQESNSCSIPFYIAYQRWIISAYKKKFVQQNLRKKYDGLYFQTDVCALVLEEGVDEAFLTSKTKLDLLFPLSDQSEFKSNFWVWGLIIGGMILLFSIAYLRGHENLEEFV